MYLYKALSFQGSDRWTEDETTKPTWEVIKMRQAPWTGRVWSQVIKQATAYYTTTDDMYV